MTVVKISQIQTYVFLPEYRPSIRAMKMQKALLMKAGYIMMIVKTVTGE